MRKVSADGTITTVAGTGVAGYSGDGGPATAAQVSSSVYSIAVDPSSNLYLDRGNHRIRKVAGNGTITTFAGTGTAGFRGRRPGRICNSAESRGSRVDAAGNVYISDTGNNVCAVFRTA